AKVAQQLAFLITDGMFALHARKRQLLSVDVRPQLAGEEGGINACEFAVERIELIPAELLEGNLVRKRLIARANAGQPTEVEAVGDGDNELIAVALTPEADNDSAIMVIRRHGMGANVRRHQENSADGQQRTEIAVSSSHDSLLPAPLAPGARGARE